MVLKNPRLARMVTPGWKVTEELERKRRVREVTHGEPSALGGTVTVPQQLSKAACSCAPHSLAAQAAA